MTINNSTDSVFIKKLTNIVEANLSDENFGVKELSEKSRMNRSQIHRRLKSINNQSVSQFIREIRLKKALEMLKQDAGTVSEIAYKVGFGSSTYFIKCFHDSFGYPPGEFIKYAFENNENTTREVKTNSSQKRIKRMLFPLLSIVFIIVFGYLSFSKYFIKTEPEISIAVLPLKNLSNDSSIQHLADGLMDDILTRLSYVKELEVKSRISSEKLRDIKMSAGEIAKELGVMYFLEGSILPEHDTIRINVQLIDAKTDEHKWADSYDKNLAGIRHFVSDVSKQIVDTLKIKLTSKESKQIEKDYTKNEEAYNLYLKGRYFYNHRTKEDLYHSIDYYNQALNIDSNYALAYSGLAEVYNELTRMDWTSWDRGYAQTIKNAKKAIAIDYNIAEAHAVLGHIAGWHQWDWEMMKKELEIALKLNPNSASANNYYSVYLMRMGDNDKARYYKNKAMELSPYDVQWFISSAVLYYQDKNFEEVLKENQKASELNKQYKYAYLQNFKAYIYLEQNEKAIEELMKFIRLDMPEKEYDAKIDKIYSESGINGVIHWMINRRIIPEEQRKNELDSCNQYGNAYWYCFLGNKDSALYYLEKEYEFGYSSNLPKIKNNPDFKILYDEPRFKELLRKMNLPVD